ncbi:MAG TPA: cation:proton antiporter [Polyangiales bacterium]|nr:cation:proton antiporter [Polyangiales bacterium]
MHLAHDFLRALTTVLCVAAVTTIVFQRLHQPVVLGYLLAGLIVGPYVPIPLVADREIVQALSELGVILLMFSLGLEFSMRKLAQVAPTAGLTAVVQSSVMLYLGYLTAQAFGWSTLASVFAGAIVAISSTTIIAKAFDEQRISGSLRELVVGVLIVEDLIAILLMTALTAMTAGGGLTASVLLHTTGRLLMFLVGLVVVGLLVVPRVIAMVRKLDRPETMLVVGIGICFAGALVALEFGYSVALGAFIAGSLVAESGEGPTIEHLVRPIRDMFAAVFFVSVGMLIDPRVVAGNWLLVLVFTLLVIFGKIIGVTFGAFLSGVGVRTAIRSGMSLAQIGEFSFIIAGLATSLKVAGDVLYPVAVAVSAITTLSTPWLIQGSERVASFVDSRLPPALQTFATLYGSWVERLRSTRRADAVASTRRLYRLLALDALLLGALVIGTSIFVDDMVGFLERRLQLHWLPARILLAVLVVTIATPFCIGIFRLSHHLGLKLAEAALPELESGRPDPSLAPRRALVATLQLSAVVLVGLPLIAVTQPFLRGPSSAIALALLLSLFGLSVWRSATRLQGHVRAGAQMFMAALSTPPPAQADARKDLQRLLHGLGEPVALRLPPSSAAIGRTLSELNLRGLTGATVLAITRDDGGVIIPTAQESLHAGDVLALAGTYDALEQASRLLREQKPA